MMGSSISYMMKHSGAAVNLTDNSIKESTTTDKFSISQSSKNLGFGNKPKVNNKTSVKDYSTNKKTLGGQTIDKIVKKMNATVHIPNETDGVQQSFLRSVEYYNRFKVANPNMVLRKGFAHVFFVRPDCNLFNESGKKPISSVNNNPLFNYAWKHTPSLLKELTMNNGMEHDFLFSLSNAAISFSPNDEYINTDVYGKTYTGYKIAYGKNNTDSKTAGTFNVSFKDDRNLHIYQLQRLWVEYINAVFRGQLAPKTEYIFDKILDYATACYYIVTAEDGETIIFWSKYYGVFPTNIPSSQYAWAEGNVISNPTLEITFQYSFKEDFNPYSLVEFNTNARIPSSGVKYLPVYDKNLGHVGRTYVGAPFIECIERKGNATPFMYKLRFREKAITY